MWTCSPCSQIQASICPATINALEPDEKSRFTLSMVATQGSWIQSCKHLIDKQPLHSYWQLSVGWIIMPAKTTVCSGNHIYIIFFMQCKKTHISIKTFLDHPLKLLYVTIFPYHSFILKSSIFLQCEGCYCEALAQKLAMWGIFLVLKLATKMSLLKIYSASFKFLQLICVRAIYCLHSKCLS